MRIIMKAIFGSQCYGTSLPSSDIDYKSIFIPSPQSILLQQAPRIIVNNTKKDSTVKNTATDIDDEKFSLHEFFRLLAQSQTVVTDMLFVPDNLIVECDKNLWAVVKNIGMRQLTNKCVSFASYCKSQSNKYGIKGSRVAAMKLALEIVAKYKDHDLVESMANEFREQEKTNEWIKIVNLPHKDGTPLYHIEVCGRKIPFTSKISRAKECYQKIYDAYGQRARLAQQNDSVDFKALYHAVRVASEAKELLSTGKITFPRPEASILLQIRRGNLPYREVAEMIEKGLIDLEEAQSDSVLPPEPDYEAARRLICRVYAEEIFTAPELRDIIENKLLKQFVLGSQ